MLYIWFMHTKCIRIMYATFDGTRSGCSSGARATRNPCGTGASTGACCIPSRVASSYEIADYRVEVMTGAPGGCVAAAGSSNGEGIGASWSSSTRSRARAALLPRGRHLGLAGLHLLPQVGRRHRGHYVYESSLQKNRTSEVS